MLYIVNMIAIAAIAAVGLNILIGFTGLISLGHGAFFRCGGLRCCCAGDADRTSLLSGRPRRRDCHGARRHALRDSFRKTQGIVSDDCNAGRTVYHRVCSRSLGVGHAGDNGNQPSRSVSLRNEPARGSQLFLCGFPLSRGGDLERGQSDANTLRTCLHRHS